MKWLSAALFPLLLFVFLKESKVWLNSKWVQVLLRTKKKKRWCNSTNNWPYVSIQPHAWRLCLCFVFFLVWQLCASVVFQPQMRADITRFLLKLPGWISGQTHAACSEASPIDGATGLRDPGYPGMLISSTLFHSKFRLPCSCSGFPLAEPAASFGFQMKIYIYISSPSWSCVLKTIIWLHVTHQSAPTRPAALWYCLQKSNRTVLKRSKFISKAN